MHAHTGNGTQVVDDFLKVPGAKVFNVTKHKVTFHDVDATPEPSPGADAEGEASGGSPEAVAEAGNGAGDEGEAAGDNGASPTSPTAATAAEAEAPEEASDKHKKRVRVRAVTELERVVFLSRERILVLACPSGPTSPGLVKSNHHLTELQKMTFMRRDPTLVTLHYLAPERVLPDGEEGAGAGDGGSPAVSAGSTKRNVYRFGLDDKEAFIRIIRGALQRFQA